MVGGSSYVLALFCRLPSKFNGHTNIIKVVSQTGWTAIYPQPMLPPNLLIQQQVLL